MTRDDASTSAAPAATCEPCEGLTAGRFALLLAAFVLATFPGVLLGRATFIVRDFGVFGYPLAHYHRECFWQGQLPLWNPLSSCGIPFLAQWNTLTLYPLSLIYLVLPLPWSLSLFCLAHLFLGGLGMYLLARRWTGDRLAAALAGVAYAFGGLSLNALMWPNIGAALGWLPWVVMLVQRGWREGGRSLGWGALAGAMQMLAGGPEPTLLTWVILAALAVGDWRGRLVPRLTLARRFAAAGGLAALVSAAQLLPFLQLLLRSQRDSGFGSSEWAMPPWGWASFLVPLFRAVRTPQGFYLQPDQYWTSSYYVGIGTVWLALVGVVRARGWAMRAAAALGALGLLLALGDAGLLYRLLRAGVPGIGFIRFPIKFVVLVVAAAPLLAAGGLAAMARAPRAGRRFEVWTAIALAALIGLLAAVAVALPAGQPPGRAVGASALGRAAFLAAAVALALAAPRAPPAWRTLCGCGLLAAVWLDLATHMPGQNPSVRASVCRPGWASAQLKMDPQPRVGQSRLMPSPAAEQAVRMRSVPGFEENYLLQRLAFAADCNLLEDVPQVHGFFSLTPGEIHSVIVLPGVRADREFPALLDFLGVAQTTAPGNALAWVPRPTAMPLVTAGQRPVFMEERTAFQAFFDPGLDLRRVAFLPPGAEGAVAAAEQPGARVSALEFGRERIALDAEAPGPFLVVVSQTYYPVWRAYVDGRRARLWRANYAFQAVDVPAGHHRVELRYEDRMLQAGAVLSAAGLLACVGLLSGRLSRVA